MAVRWSDEAKLDLRTAALYFLETSDDVPTARAKSNQLVRNIRALALDAMKWQVVQGSVSDLRKWRIDDYLIYFFRSGPRTIYVVRVYPARGFPLEPGSI